MDVAADIHCSEIAHERLFWLIEDVAVVAVGITWLAMGAGIASGWEGLLVDVAVGVASGW